MKITVVRAVLIFAVAIVASFLLILSLDKNANEKPQESLRPDQFLQPGMDS